MPNARAGIVQTLFKNPVADIEYCQVCDRASIRTETTITRLSSAEMSQLAEAIDDAVQTSLLARTGLGIEEGRAVVVRGWACRLMERHARFIVILGVISVVGLLASFAGLAAGRLSELAFLVVTCLSLMAYCAATAIGYLGDPYALACIRRKNCQRRRSCRYEATNRRAGEYLRCTDYQKFQSTRCGKAATFCALCELRTLYGFTAPKFEQQTDLGWQSSRLD